MFDSLKSMNKSDFAPLKRKISNWNKTADLIYTIEDPEEVLKLLQVESVSYNRNYNRLRLYQRYSHLRRVQERSNFKEFLKDIKFDETVLPKISNSFKFSCSLINTPVTHEYLLSLLKAEIETLNRPYIRDKIYGYMQSRRQKEEKKYLRLVEESNNE